MSMSYAEAVEAVTAPGGMFEVVADHVSRTDEKITIPGWMSFEQTTRAPRTGRNPRTGREVRIPPGKTIRFKPGKNLRNLT